jgi:hypothetical protein
MKFSQKTIIILLKKMTIYLSTYYKIIKLDNYLKNTKDGLELKRKIFNDFKKNKYPFITNIDIRVNKKDCLHNKCSKFIWNYIKNKN